MTQWFVDAVREMSDGRLDITLYPGGELVPSMEIVDALAQDVIEMAYSSSPYYTGLDPALALDGSGLPPYLWRGPVDMLELLEYWGLGDIMGTAYAGLGVHLVKQVLCENAHTWSKYPLNSVEDLKGHKLRLWGGYVSDTFVKLGAAPAFIPHEEVYTALATGVIDGSGTGAGKFLSLALYEHCPYIYQPPLLAPASTVLLASQNSWDALPDDLKEIVNVAAYALGIKWHVDALVDEGQNIWSTEAQEKLGITVMTWSDDDLKAFAAAALSCLPDLAAKSPQCAEGARIIEDFLKFKGYVD